MLSQKNTFEKVDQMTKRQNQTAEQQNTHLSIKIRMFSLRLIKSKMFVCVCLLLFFVRYLRVN